MANGKRRRPVGTDRTMSEIPDSDERGFDKPALRRPAFSMGDLVGLIVAVALYPILISRRYVTANPRTVWPPDVAGARARSVTRLSA
jgi:hypothetical protein